MQYGRRVSYEVIHHIPDCPNAQLWAGVRANANFKSFLR